MQGRGREVGMEASCAKQACAKCPSGDAGNGKTSTHNALVVRNVSRSTSTRH